MHSQPSDPTDDLNTAPQLPRDPSPGIGCIGAGFIMADCHLVAYRERLQPGGHRVANRGEQARDVAARHGIPRTYSTRISELLADPAVEVVDVAVPPDVQLEVIREVVKHADHLRGMLAQKPLGTNYARGRRDRAAVRRGRHHAGRESEHALRPVGAGLQDAARPAASWASPVLATIDMRAIPHWMPWQQRQGWVTLRIMSIHHLDTFRYWFGDPRRVFASVRPDPRTSRQFAHEDGICLYILEYDNGLRARRGTTCGPARREGAAGRHRHSLAR